MKLQKLAVNRYPQSFILTESFGVSRGRDTHGYTIARLHYEYHGHKGIAKCMGGGYDMLGENLSTWLLTILKEDTDLFDTFKHNLTQYLIVSKNKLPYGLFSNIQNSMHHAMPNRVTEIKTADEFFTTFYLDGACGESSMWLLAKLAGLSYKTVLNKRRTKLDHFVVSSMTIDEIMNKDFLIW